MDQEYSKILIRSVQIFHQSSPFHKKKRNVLIKNGKISAIGQKDYRADITIDGKGMILTIGWFDLRANFCDPGNEHKEDLATGAATAAAGGFTEVALLPNTNPPIQSKNEISYVASGNRNRLVQLHPIAAVTEELAGEALTEMIDLHEAGAVAFSDGEKPIWHTDILLRSLQYLQKFDGLLINRPEDVRLNLYGSMHEGVHSTRLGLKGMPSLAEELVTKRDLEILKYTGGKIHFSNISTKGTVEAIRIAKKTGLKVTADVAAHQLMFRDEDNTDFDTNFKINPPFREKEDIKALEKGLADGTIDAIVSSHTPQDEESKKLEYDLADFGILGLQSVAHCIKHLSGAIDLDLLLSKVSTTPREILGLEIPNIDEGVEANLTLFDPKRKWMFDGRSNHSKSINSPFWQQELTGKAVAVFNNGRSYLDSSLLP